MISNRARGEAGEERAARYLKEEGHYILDRNYQSYRGEVDIISLDGDCLVFVEVKTRSNLRYGRPEEAITEEKKRRLSYCAKNWVYRNEYEGSLRFDVIAIEGKDLRHYENAFEPP